MPLDELFERRFVASTRVGQKPILRHPRQSQPWCHLAVTR
jgi:hypothetical protein